MKRIVQRGTIRMIMNWYICGKNLLFSYVTKMRQNNYLGIYWYFMWGKPAPICMQQCIYSMFYSPGRHTVSHSLVYWLAYSLPIVLATKRTFILLRRVFNFSFHQHYLFFLVVWPVHFSSINILNFYYILYQNIPCIHLLHSKLCGHITLNGLLTKSTAPHLQSPSLN